MSHGDDDGHETCIRLSISSTINWRVAWWWVGIYLLINFRKSRRLLGRLQSTPSLSVAFVWISASHTPNISHTVDSKRSLLTLPKALATAQLTRLLRQQFNDIKIDVRKHTHTPLHLTRPHLRIVQTFTCSTHHNPTGYHHAGRPAHEHIQHVMSPAEDRSGRVRDGSAADSAQGQPHHIYIVLLQ